MQVATTTAEDFLRSLEGAKAERRKQKLTADQIEERPLTPWERYRALTDHYDSLQDHSEQSDRKARFGLLILGSLNAVNLLLAARGELVGLPRIDALFASMYVGSYVMLSLGLFLYAIAALRPRRMAGEELALSAAAALRGPGATMHTTAQEYCERWRSIELSVLNDELATLTYIAARRNTERTRAVQRVYAGLCVLVVLTAILLVVLTTSALA